MFVAKLTKLIKMFCLNYSILKIDEQFKLGEFKSDLANKSGNPKTLIK